MEEAFFQQLEPSEQALVRSQRGLMQESFLLSPSVARVEVRCTVLPCAPVAPVLVSSSLVALVAITGQLVRLQGCTDVEATRSRVAQPECVERLVPGSPPICVCRIFSRCSSGQSSP